MPTASSNAATREERSCWFREDAADAEHAPAASLTLQMVDRVCQVQVAHSDRDALQAIVEDLLERRLIACGQVLGPVLSTYRWQGAVQREEEWLALLKTAAASLGAVLERVALMHSYDVPEMLVTEVSGGHAPYLRWVLEESAAAQG